MNYFKNFLTGFFIVFFVNYLFPGIDVVNQTKIPHIGGDFIFAALLGLFNSLIFPLLKAFDRYLSLVRICVVTVLLNFGTYALLKLLPLGVYITNIKGYFFGAIFVSFGSVFLSFVQLKRYQKGLSAHKTHENHHLD